MKLSLNHDTTNLIFDLKDRTGQGINHIVCEAIKKYHAEQLSNKTGVHNDHNRSKTNL